MWCPQIAYSISIWWNVSLLSRPTPDAVSTKQRGKESGRGREAAVPYVCVCVCTYSHTLLNTGVCVVRRWFENWRWNFCVVRWQQQLKRQNPSGSLTLILVAKCCFFHCIAYHYHSKVWNHLLINGFLLSFNKNSLIQTLFVLFEIASVPN